MGLDTGCGLAADTKVETPEGAMTIRAVAGKAIAVFSRNNAGGILFRMMRNVRKVDDQHPVIKITLDNGLSFRVAPEQVLYTASMDPVAAAALEVGVGLQPAFHFPEGYTYRTDSGEEVVSPHALRVTRVEPAGTAEVYALGVHDTGCFFVSAGVLCQAEPA